MATALIVKEMIKLINDLFAYIYIMLELLH